MTGKAIPKVRLAALSSKIIVPTPMATSKGDHAPLRALRAS